MAHETRPDGRLYYPPEPPARTEPAGYGAVDLDATVREYVRLAVDRYRLGETYWYSVTPTIITSNPVLGPTPAYVVTLYGRAPVPVGSVLIEGAVQSGFPTQAEFDEIVLNLIGSLRDKASTALR